ncbi:GNAT family N-acetyltransferase [Taklimakanibacter lacteus]|uniref:GNAT family N-acetyltransferase n=1 Tax=Taklimakanibacter lacteus TaxID=2268456 RepID=UPI000E662225
MKIRSLAPSDWELKRRLRLAALTDSPQAFGSSYEREAGYTETDWRLWPANGVFFAAFADDERALGIAAGYREPSSPAVARLISMWVAPEARRLGVAAQLTASVVAWTREQDAEWLELEVAPGNDAAMQAYLRSGFVLTGRTPSRACGAVLELMLSTG